MEQLERKKKHREITIDALETPKGNVPTVNGLETAMNHVYSMVASLSSQIDQKLTEIDNNLTKITKMLENQHTKVGGLSESLASLIVQLAKSQALEKQQREIIEQRQQISRADLTALKEELTRILDKLEDRVIESVSQTQ